MDRHLPQPGTVLGLDPPVMAAGLNEVGASGELASCAGFLSVDSATKPNKGRGLKCQGEIPKAVPTVPHWVQGPASALGGLQDALQGGPVFLGRANERERKLASFCK